MAIERWVSAAERGPEEGAVQRSLRPQLLEAYVGQTQLKEKLRIAIEAARGRGEPMEHSLLHGPPGLGKTTIAHVIANEMGSAVHVTSGPALTKGSDLAGALTGLGANDVLFIDEIHRLPAAVEEFIYPAMEDGRIDIAVDTGMHGRTVSIPLQPFTLIGATTRAGLLTAALRSRFGISHTLEFYPSADLLMILERSAGLLQVQCDDGSLHGIAERSRGTPRIANRLLRRVRDYAQVRGDGRVNLRIVEEALALEGVDAMGLDQLDRRYLSAVLRVYGGGPVGVEALAATMGEDAGTLSDMVEPFLLQRGLVARTPRGRELTEQGRVKAGEAGAPEVGVAAINPAKGAKEPRGGGR